MDVRCERRPERLIPIGEYVRRLKQCEQQTKPNPEPTGQELTLLHRGFGKLVEKHNGSRQRYGTERETPMPVPRRLLGTL